MDQEDYTDFVHTGASTLAGRYLRMFWQPLYRAEDLAPGYAAPIRIMSEDFTLYRGESGGVHLVAFRCAHRGSQLSTGWVEGETIRCRYHGWRYDGAGQCVEQPGEEEGFAKKTRIRNYPTEEYLGLIFAYLGEGEAPPLRRDPEMAGEGVLEVYAPEVWPCNYFNRIDNACDAAHVVFTHRDSRLAVNELPLLPELTAEETEYGIQTKVDTAGRPNWSLHFIMPNTNHFKASIRLRDPEAPKGMVSRLLWRVPVDDLTCISFGLDFAALTGEAAKTYQERRREMREEINALSKSMEIIELAYEAEAQAARPGVKDWDVWAATMYALMRNGSEFPVHYNWVSGKNPPRTLTRPSLRILERGDVIMNELEASWIGYRAQGVQPVFVEEVHPGYQELIKVQRQVFNRVCASMKPETTAKELGEITERAGAEAAPKSGLAAGATAALTMHGRGAGDDGPIVIHGTGSSRQLGVRLLENMVFICKPSVTTADGAYRLTWGDTVVVTSRGARRLGKRAHEIVIA